MVIFDENNKSIQIKRFLSKSTRVPHAKFYICKKVFFFENFDYRATLSLKFENLKKKAKADEAMNIHLNIIPSHKTTHADNKCVTSNLVVNDIEQISFVSPVDDSNRKVANSLVNESQQINVDHNTYQNFTTSTNKRGTKETHQLGDEFRPNPNRSKHIITTRSKKSPT